VYKTFALRKLLQLDCI